MQFLINIFVLYIIYVIYLIFDYYDFKNKKDKKIEKEINDYFRPKPAKNIEEVEEWCKTKLKK